LVLEHHGNGKAAVCLQQRLFSDARTSDGGFQGALVGPTNLSVSNNFSVRAITLRTLEHAPVVIWLVRFDATEPHQAAAVRAFR
jgi:hypothetical protein